MIKYQEHFYRTGKTRFFLFNDTVMVESLEEVEDCLLSEIERNNYDISYGHYIVKVMDPYNPNKNLPMEKDYWIDAFRAKDLMSKNCSTRFLYISPDVKEIYSEVIFAENNNNSNDDYTFDYGIMYGNHQILKPGNIYKTNFFNEITDWDLNLSDYVDRFHNLDIVKHLYIQECSEDLDSVCNVKFDFKSRSVGYDFKLITKDFKSVYVDKYETMIVPIASIVPAEDDICAQYNGKEFDTFLGAWE